MDRPRRIQLHLVLPYSIEPRRHPVLKAKLEEGYLVRELQRLTDREVAVILELPPADASGATPA
jgi:hypothetical protein